jgi:hypothetical protein
MLGKEFTLVLYRAALFLTTQAQKVIPDDPNCAECQPVHRLLEECGLPSLLASPDIFEGDPTVRNATGAPPVREVEGSYYITSFDEDGPATRVLTNSSQANCFCKEARLSLYGCSGCTVLPEKGVPHENSSDIALSYKSECAAWGYFQLEKGGWPSTTITSLPTATAPTQNKVPACSANCDIVADQIQQCGLNYTLASDMDDYHMPSTFLADGYVTEPLYFMYNRTDAQCFCTVPVMNNLLACRLCSNEGSGPKDRLQVANNYNNDCNEWVYYATAERIDPKIWTGANTISDASPSDAGTGPNSSATGTAPRVVGTGKAGGLMVPIILMFLGMTW